MLGKHPPCIVNIAGLLAFDYLVGKRHFRNNTYFLGTRTLIVSQ